MKADKRGNVEYIDFPAEETFRVMEAMGQAEQSGDMDALRWAARRILFMANIYEGDTTKDNDPYIPVCIFNRLWEAEQLKDPPPESIADIIARIDQDEPPATDPGKEQEIAREDARADMRDSAIALIDSLLEATQIDPDGDVALHCKAGLEALKVVITEGAI